MNLQAPSAPASLEPKDVGVAVSQEHISRRVSALPQQHHEQQLKDPLVLSRESGK